MGKLYVTTTLHDKLGNPVAVISDVISCSSQAKADAAIALLEASDTNWENNAGEFTGSQATRVVYCPSL